MKNCLWIPCALLMPEEGTWVLVWVRGDGLRRAMLLSGPGIGQYWHTDNRRLDLEDVTHWTPEPPAPGGDEQCGKYCLRSVVHGLAHEYVAMAQLRADAKDDDGELLMKAAALRVYEVFAPFFQQSVDGRKAVSDRSSLPKFRVAATFNTPGGGQGKYERVFRAATDTAAMNEMTMWLINGLCIVDESHLRTLDARPEVPTSSQ